MATAMGCSSSLRMSARTQASSILKPSQTPPLSISKGNAPAFSLQALRASVTSTTSISETTIDASSSSHVQLAEDPPASASAPKHWKSKGSAQLTRWARSRKLRSGKPALPPSESILSPLSEPSPAYPGAASPSHMREEHDDYRSMSPPFLRPENTVYMVSDGTGWTAEHSVHAALGQFEHCLVDHGCPVSTHLFSQINDVERLMEIIQDAGKERAIVVYTLADPTLAEAAKKACELHGIPHLDIFGPITELLSTYLGVTPSGLARGAPGRKTTLSKQYFKRIEAVEFTIKQDDGALPKNLHKADIVLVGVSRTSKTPLSTYIAQKGYKVANVPLVLGIDPPRELFEVDQSKIFALTINPNFLHSIRTARSKSLGVSSRTSYNDMDHIKKELDFSKNLFVQNPRWPVIEVTGKAIEETAAVILRIYHDRERKYVMPRISWRY